MSIGRGFSSCSMNSAYKEQFVNSLINNGLQSDTKKKKKDNTNSRQMK